MENVETNINTQEMKSSPKAQAKNWMLRITRKVIAKKIPVLIVSLFIIVIGLAIYEQTIYSKYRKKTVTIEKQVLVRRSIDPEIIKRELTGKAIDVNTGKIVLAARIFTLNDSTVYLELDVLHPPVGTLVDYIRYKNGRYVDNGEITISNQKTKNLLFSWSINKLLVGLTDGNWRIATYTNGILAKRVNYQIKNNKVAKIYPDVGIHSTDSDYSLQNSLAETGLK